MNGICSICGLYITLGAALFFHCNYFSLLKHQYVLLLSP
jgi:hypothetical protein